MRKRLYTIWFGLTMFLNVSVIGTAIYRDVVEKLIIPYAIIILLMLCLLVCKKAFKTSWDNYKLSCLAVFCVTLLIAIFVEGAEMANESNKGTTLENHP